MASPVLYGIGTPRFEIKTGIVNFEIVASSTATSVTIKGLSDLSALDANIFLVGRIITTNNTNGQETRGVITSYNDTSKTLNVAAGWTNGNPGADQNIIIADFQIDLPLCEVFTMEPELDFITRKLYNGNKDNYKRGFYQNWVLDYSGYIKAQTLQLLRPLYSVQYKDFIFYPRNDNPQISFIVDISDKFSLSQIPWHQGHRGLTISLMGTRRLPAVNLTPSADVLPTGYGEAPYGGSDNNPYGDNL